jgi:hypothetical protein
MKNILFSLLTIISLSTSSFWSQCNTVANFTYSIGANGLVTFYNNSTDSCFFYSPDYLRVGPNDIFQVQFMNNGIHNTLMFAQSDDGLCNDSLEVDIEITNITCLAFANLSILLQPNGGCNFTNNSNLDGILDPGDGSAPFFLGVNETYLYGYYLNGTFQVSLVIADSLNPGCTDTAFTSVTFSGLPGINCETYFEIIQTYDTINGAYLDDILIIDYSFGIGTLEYQWIFYGGADTILIELPEPTHTFSSPGEYAIDVLMHDSENCFSSYSDSLYISAKSSGYTVTVIHYNNLIASIESVENTFTSTVSPNPFNEFFHLNVHSLVSENVTLTIRDISGKIIEQSRQTFSQGDNRIHLSGQNLNDGVYLLTIQGETTPISQTVKLVKN